MTSKYEKTCPECGEVFKSKATKRIMTCGRDKCKFEHYKKAQLAYRMQKGNVKEFATCEEARIFLNHFDFAKRGFMQLGKYPQALQTLLTKFKEFLNGM